METPPLTKPPLGVMPEWLWKENRMWDLIGAINRYREAKLDIPGNWMLELKQRVEEFISSPVPRVDFDSNRLRAPLNLFNP